MSCLAGGCSSSSCFLSGVCFPSPFPWVSTTNVNPDYPPNAGQHNATQLDLSGPSDISPFPVATSGGPQTLPCTVPPPPVPVTPGVCVCVLFVYMHVTACTASPQALQRQTLMQMLFSLSPACIIEPLFFFRQGTSTLDSPVELHSFVQDRIEFSRWFPVQSIFFYVIHHTDC